MKNITVTVDDEVYRNARIKAAALDTSVSALVKRYLTELAAGETAFDRLKRQERELRAEILGSGFRAAENVSRGELHDRER